MKILFLQLLHISVQQHWYKKKHSYVHVHKFAIATLKSTCSGNFVSYWTQFKGYSSLFILFFLIFTPNKKRYAAILVFVVLNLNFLNFKLEAFWFISNVAPAEWSCQVADGKRLNWNSNSLPECVKNNPSDRLAETKPCSGDYCLGGLSQNMLFCYFWVILKYHWNSDFEILIVFHKAKIVLFWELFQYFSPKAGILYFELFL